MAESDPSDDDRTASDAAPHSETLLAEGSHAPTLDDLGSPPGALPESAPTSSLTAGIEALPVVAREHYEMGRTFAKGGIGKISRALDRRLDRTVAIKELRRASRYARLRFLREIRITAKLQHPNIVQLHEAGRWPDGEPFFAMKLVEGDSFEGVIASCVSQEDHLRMLRHVTDVADAMAHAHSRRIVHRDLKPGNVLVGPFGETVVIDWGLAKDLVDDEEEELASLTDKSDPARYETTEGVVLGTPSYMPPEQAAGKPVDERADVYALGAILYQALSGKPPYFEYHPRRVLEQVVAAPPTPLRKLSPHLPRDLLAIVDKAMARDVADRYRTAAVMADELSRFTAGRLVAAYDYSFPELIKRFVKRHRGAVGTALVGAMVLLGFGVWSFRRIALERDAAEAARAAEAQARLLEAAAREEAERRLDEAVLSAASADLEHDPTRAVARLKRLGVLLPGAATIAADAAERGVASHVLRGHTDRIDAVAYSPDGRLVASSGLDGVVRLFVRDTGQVLQLTKHEARVPALGFAGDVLVSADYDGVIAVWDTHKGALESSLVAHQGQRIGALAVLGTMVATVADDGVRVWNVESGKAALVFEQPAERTGFATFVPGGARLVTGSHQGTLHVWDLMGQDHAVLDGHDGRVVDAVVSPDGAWLVSAGIDGTVRRWDLAGQKAKGLVLGTHARGAQVVQFLDADRVVSGGMDGRVIVWRLSDGTSTVVAQHQERVTAIATEGGRFVASAGWDNRAVVTDADTGGMHVLEGHDSVISALAFSPSGDQLASASWDRTVRLWPTETPHRQLLAHGVGVKTVAFDASGARLASGGHDNRVKLWNAKSGALERTFEGHTDHVFRVLFSPDGRRVASSSDDLTVRLWGVDDGDERVLEGHSADVEELAFSPDGKWLASAAEDAMVGLWAMAEDGGGLLEGHTRAVTAVAFTPDSSLLVSAGADGQVIVWDLTTRKPRVSRALHAGGVTSLAISPGGVIVSTGRDGRVLSYTAESIAAETGPRHVVTVEGADRVALSDSGSRVAVSSTGGAITLCTLSSATPVCKLLSGHEERVHAMRFAADDDLLVTGSEDTTVRFWSVATGESRVVRVHRSPVFDVALRGESVASASADRTIGLLVLNPPPALDTLRAELDRLTTLELPVTTDAGRDKRTLSTPASKAPPTPTPSP